MAVLADRLVAFARRNELYGLAPPGFVGPWDGSWAKTPPGIEDPQVTLVADLCGARSLVEDVRMAVDMGRLRMRIALRQNPALDLQVRCHVMAFGRDLPSHYLRRAVEVRPQGGPRLYDGPQELPDSGLAGHFAGRTLEIALPLQDLLGARDLLFGVILLRGGRRVGKTAFRIVRLA
jgi:hypothetical protein